MPPSEKEATTTATTATSSPADPAQSSRIMSDYQPPTQVTIAVRPSEIEMHASASTGDSDLKEQTPRENMTLLGETKTMNDSNVVVRVENVHKVRSILFSFDHFGGQGTGTRTAHSKNFNFICEAENADKYLKCEGKKK